MINAAAQKGGIEVWAHVYKAGLHSAAPRKGEPMKEIAQNETRQKLRIKKESSFGNVTALGVNNTAFVATRRAGLPQPGEGCRCAR
jgi:hypothetical protein